MTSLGNSLMRSQANAIYCTVSQAAYSALSDLFLPDHMLPPLLLDLLWRVLLLAIVGHIVAVTRVSHAHGGTAAAAAAASLPSSACRQPGLGASKL